MNEAVAKALRDMEAAVRNSLAQQGKVEAEVARLIQQLKD